MGDNSSRYCEILILWGDASKSLLLFFCEKGTAGGGRKGHLDLLSACPARGVRDGAGGDMNTSWPHMAGLKLVATSSTWQGAFGWITAASFDVEEMRRYAH
jgi:hypothetical protein